MFLRLLGWPVDVRDRSARASFERFGDLGAGFAGQRQRASRIAVRSLNVEATYVEADDADTLECLLEGRGQHMPFDLDAHSSSGLGPDTAAAGAWEIVPRPPMTDGMFGGGWLRVTSSIVWDTELPDDRWTVMFWRDVAPASGAEHIVVRADGAKWLNGVRDDALSTPELTVDEGAVALSAGDYDDLVILPVSACATFVEQFYRWTTERGLVGYVPFNDGTGREVLADAAGTLVGAAAILRVGGRAGGSLAVASAGDALTHVAGPWSRALGRSALTFEAWVLPNAYSPAGTIVSTRTGGVGWALSLVPNAFTGRVGLRGEVGTTLGVAYSQSAAAVASTFAPGVQTHVAMVWQQASGIVTLYVNGRAVTASGTSYPGAAAADDSAVATVTTGNTPGLTDVANGRISEWRLYSTALSALEVYERWRAGIEGAPGALPKPCSPLPVLAVDGEVVHGRQALMRAQTRDQTIVQHGPKPGAAAGWRNASRSMPFELAPEHEEPAPVLPLPIWSLLLDERFVDGNAIAAVPGPFATVYSSKPPFTVGPFGQGRAQAFGGSHGIELQALHGESLAGLRGATVVVWFRRTSVVATVRGLVRLSTAGLTPKIELRLTSAGNLQAFARPNAGEATVTATAATAVSTGPFHLCAAIVDVTASRVAVALDDAGLGLSPVGLYTSATGAWSAERFDGTFDPATSLIGSSLVGDVAMVALYPRALARAEILAMWHAGRRGVLR